jgi:hypothetical protein
VVLLHLQRVRDGEVLPGDIDVHGEIAVIIENPLYLLLDTTDGAGVRDLPVQILESEVLLSHFFPSNQLCEAMAGEHGASEAIAFSRAIFALAPFFHPIASSPILPLFIDGTS